MQPQYAEYPGFLEQLDQLDQEFRKAREQLLEAYKQKAYTTTEDHEAFTQRYKANLEALRTQHNEHVLALHSEQDVPILQFWERALNGDGTAYVLFHDEEATPDRREEATIRKRPEDGALVLETRSTVVFPDDRKGRDNLEAHMMYGRLYMHTWEAKKEEPQATSSHNS